MAQFSMDDLAAVYRRRKRLLLLPFLFVTLACAALAFLLPRKYSSSTTILVQRDEVLNPLVNFTMAVSMASLDRLRSLNEIVYSRATIEQLMDTLGLSATPRTEEEHERVVTEIGEDIRTDRKGEDSFTIAYLDTDPGRAMLGASFLARHFIRTRLAVEGQRNEYAVGFYERKLEELRRKFEGSQQEVIAVLRQRLHETPLEDRTLYSRLEDADRGIARIDDAVKTRERALAGLRSFPRTLAGVEARRAIVELQGAELPFVAELRSVMAGYHDVAARYTDRHPSVRTAERQVYGLLDRMRLAVETDLAQLRKERRELEERRGANLAEIQKVSVAKKEDQATTSNFDIYQNLYDEMKVKLEQARTNRDLARKATDQFIIIDPARVPIEPAEPNRVLIILGGLCLGLLLGVAAAGVGELTDARVRSPHDVVVYGRPILAYLPEGGAGRGG